MTKLTLRSTVTRRQAEPVPPDMAERLAQQQHHQVANTTSTTEPKARDPEKPKREQHALQAAFLAANRNRPVAVYLMNGIRLNGTLCQFDQFTILLQGPDGINSLVFKHAVSTIAPDHKDKCL